MDHFFHRAFFMRNFALSTNGNGVWQAIFDMLIQRTRRVGPDDISRIINACAYDAHMHIH